MHSEIATTALLAFAMLGGWGCASSKPNRPTSNSNPNPITVGQAQSGREIALTVGQHLLVRLPSNHTTGYRWTLVDSPGVPAIVRSDGPAVYETNANNAGMVGVGGTEAWSFTGVRTGDAELRL